MLRSVVVALFGHAGDFIRFWILMGAKRSSYLALVLCFIYLMDAQFASGLFLIVSAFAIYTGWRYRLTRRVHHNYPDCTGDWYRDREPFEEDKYLACPECRACFIETPNNLKLAQAELRASRLLRVLTTQGRKKYGI